MLRRLFAPDRHFYFSEGRTVSIRVQNASAHTNPGMIISVVLSLLILAGCGSLD